LAFRFHLIDVPNKYPKKLAYIYSNNGSFERIYVEFERKTKHNNGFPTIKSPAKINTRL